MEPSRSRSTVLERSSTPKPALQPVVQAAVGLQLNGEACTLIQSDHRGVIADAVVRRGDDGDEQIEQHHLRGEHVWEVERKHRGRVHDVGVDGCRVEAHIDGCTQRSHETELAKGAVIIGGNERKSDRIPRDHKTHQNEEGADVLHNGGHHVHKSPELQEAAERRETHELDVEENADAMQEAHRLRGKPQGL
eukprot:2904387-Prymnesium_polylepis.1